jgi:sec-independent protein translocase protein TatA
MIGTSELTIVLVVVVFLFGTTKIPELARAFGQARREYEKGAEGERQGD